MKGILKNLRKDKKDEYKNGLIKCIATKTGIFLTRNDVADIKIEQDIDRTKISQRFGSTGY